MDDPVEPRKKLARISKNYSEMAAIHYELMDFAKKIKPYLDTTPVPTVKEVSWKEFCEYDFLTV